MGKLFGNNGYLLAESENSIMGIKLGIINSLSPTSRESPGWDAARDERMAQRGCGLGRVHGAGLV